MWKHFFFQTGLNMFIFHCLLWRVKAVRFIEAKTCQVSASSDLWPLGLCLQEALFVGLAASFKHGLGYSCPRAYDPTKLSSRSNFSTSGPLEFDASRTRDWAGARPGDVSYDLTATGNPQWQLINQLEFQIPKMKLCANLYHSFDYILGTNPLT